MTRVYVAGPMSGIPDFNFPAFHAAADALRAAGYDVVSPAELHDHTDRTWDFYMRSALVAMLACDEVVLLPGWQHSRGARLERQVAEALEMTIHEWQPALCRLHRDDA